MTKKNETSENQAQCAIQSVNNSAYKVKRVNNGNVFGTGTWYTFYCGKCGAQLLPRAKKCEGTCSFIKGCGAEADWD